MEEPKRITPAECARLHGASVNCHNVVAFKREFEKYFTVPMVLEPTEEQLRKGKIGRNDKCLCGSGAKFKQCCLKAAQTREV